VTVKQQVVIIPDQPEEGIDGYGRKTLRRSFKTKGEWEERSTSGPGSECDDEELGDDDGLN